MDSFEDDEYRNYWETNMFLQSQELDCTYFDEVISGYYDSSSPDGAQQSAKNIISERSRRKKLNERLYALRAVVPNITKMDKASIIKDAIKYIQSLNDEERRIQAEVSQLESVTAGMTSSSSNTALISDLDQVAPTFCSNALLENYIDFAGTSSSPLEVLELRVSNMGENTAVVSLTCIKRRDTVMQLCEIFESLCLQIITSTITASPGKISKTVFLECDGEKIDGLRLNIEAGIAALSNPVVP